MPALQPDAASSTIPVPHLAGPGGLHVVFSAECIPAFDWQSVGLFYSFRHVGQPGKITRLLACSEEQLKTYPKVNLEMGPTFVHKNMRFDDEFKRSTDHFPSSGANSGSASPAVAALTRRNQGPRGHI